MHNIKGSGKLGIVYIIKTSFRQARDIREQFKCRLKGWLFEYAYGRRHVW